MEKGDGATHRYGSSGSRKKVKIVPKFAKGTTKSEYKDSPTVKAVSSSSEITEDDQMSDVALNGSVIDFTPPSFDDDLFANVIDLEEFNECESEEEIVEGGHKALPVSTHVSAREIHNRFKRTPAPLHTLRGSTDFPTSELTSSLESVEWLEEDESSSSKEDFFDKLGTMPSVHQINMRESVASRRSIKIKSRDVSRGGSFVDPLSGRLLAESSSQLSSEDISVMDTQDLDAVVLSVKVEDNLFAEAQFTEYTFDDYDTNYPSDPPKFDPRMVVEKWTQERIPERPSKQRPYPVSSIIICTELKDDVERFLEYLIFAVVQFDEVNRMDDTFRETLDMPAMFNYLVDTLISLKQEQKINKFLDRKTVEHYKRKKSWGNLMESKDVPPPDVFAKYRRAVTHLDEVLGQRDAITERTESRIEDLIFEADHGKEVNGQEWMKFENLVKATLRCEGNPKLTEMVTRELKHIRDLKDEISEVRAEIIQRQHTLALLRSRMNDLENLGDGLHVRDFESLYIETQALHKKLEDRHIDLNRIHTDFQKHLHCIVHFKLKTKIQVGQLQIQSNHLLDLIEEKDICRKRLFDLEKKHANTRNQLEDLRYRYGLVDKPTLLLDFDATMENINERRQRVKELQQQYEELEAKLKKVNMASVKSKISEKKRVRFA